MAKVRVFLVEICILTTTLHFVRSRSGGTSSDRFAVSYFVDSSSGVDSARCGNVSLPCKTLAWTVGRTLEAPQNSSVYLFIAPGVYTETAAVRLGGLVAQQRRYRLIGSVDKDVVFALSVDVQLCDVEVTNIHWQSSKPVLINVLSSTIVFKNCSFSDLLLSINSQMSSLVIQHTAFRNCSSWAKGFPLIFCSSVATSTASLTIKSTNFSSNNGTLIATNGLPQASLSDVHFIANRGHLKHSLSSGQGLDASCGDSLITLDSCHVILRGTEARENTAGKVLTVVSDALGDCNVNIAQSLFTKNNALCGSILGFDGSANISVDNTQFVRNAVDGKSPRVVHVGVSVEAMKMVRCHFSCNAASQDVHRPPVGQDSSTLHVQYTNCTVDSQCPVMCGGGTSLEQGLSCVTCSAGTFSPGFIGNISSTSCQRCPAGYYADKMGMSSCIACSAGQYSDKPGSSMCLKCQNDLFTSSSGSSACQQWTIGLIIITAVCLALICIPLLLLCVTQCHEKTDESDENLSLPNKKYQALRQPGSCSSAALLSVQIPETPDDVV